MHLVGLQVEAIKEFDCSNNRQSVMESNAFVS